MKRWCPQCAKEMRVEKQPSGPEVFVCDHCHERFQVDPSSAKVILAPLSLGQMLSDVRRALDAAFPDRALEIMAELDARMTFDLDAFAPPPNAVVVARFSQPPTEIEQAFVQKILLQHNVTNAVLFLGPGESIETANRETLRRAGLRRLEVADYVEEYVDEASAGSALRVLIDALDRASNGSIDATTLNRAITYGRKVLGS